ncbi:MAG: MotA/TolQ/ExbB proton channel family protein [Victivallales bacterium]|nr:MotA/TolQ/ExbB proton channel family protein [Victivallales bacterium]
MTHRHKIIGFTLLTILLSSRIFAADKQTSATLNQVMERGGPVMFVLLGISLIALFLVFYYMMTIRTALVVPKEFINSAEDAVKKKDIELLSKVCEENSSPAANIIAAGANVFIRSKNNYQMIRDAIEDEGTRQAGLLWHRIQALQDIAVIAPMVGLLGTVLGMIKSFMGLNQELATPRPTVIASGVSMALLTTAAGLVIGITAMILHSFFRARINKVLSNLENECNKISIEMMVADSDSESPF